MDCLPTVGRLNALNGLERSPRRVLNALGDAHGSPNGTHRVNTRSAGFIVPLLSWFVKTFYGKLGSGPGDAL